MTALVPTDHQRPIRSRPLAALLLMLLACGIWDLLPSGPPPTDSALWQEILGPAKAAASSSDKCLLCHVNISDPRFTRSNLIASLESRVSIPGFWKDLAQQFDPPATSRKDDAAIRWKMAHDLDTRTMAELDERYRLALIAAVNQIRRSQGQPLLDDSPVLLAHPRLDLYAGADSPHSLSTMSCTTCHDGNAAATDFISAGHTLSDRLANATQIMRPMAYVQSNCIDCHRNVDDIRDDAPQLYAGRKLFVTRGCVDCHRMDTIASYEKRKVGPDLRHLAGNLSPQYVQAWITDPTAFRPSTLMPHIFLPDDPNAAQEAAAMTDFLFQHADDKIDSPLPPGAGDYERGRLLFQGHGLEDHDALAHHLPPGLKAGLGCLACHTNLNDWRNDQGDSWIVIDLIRRGSTRLDAQRQYAAMTYNQRQLYALSNMSTPIGDEPAFIHFGPELSAIGQQLTTGRDAQQARQWLFAWLKNPSHYNPHTLMPNLRLTDQEALDLCAYLLAQTRDKADNDLRASSQTPPKVLTILDQKPPDPWHSAVSNNPSPLTDLGGKLIAHYGCMNCHEINAPESLAQSDLDLSNWGRKPLDRLDFGQLTPERHTRQDWLMQHLTAPTITKTTYDQPRMPFFHLDSDQAQSVITFILGNRGPTTNDALMHEAMNPAALAIAKGRALTTLHNCVGCHQTELNHPAIQQYFQPQWISSYAPPVLCGEGNRVQQNFLRDFLPHVRPIRPLPKVRMPSFSLEDQEIAGLTDYFQAASHRESHDLRRWLTQNDACQLDQWALANHQVAAIDLDPAFSTPDQIAQSRADIQYKANFTANLYDCPADTAWPAPTMSQSDFARGERFVQTLQCLECHELSPPEQGGQEADPAHAKAPNLDLSWQRLQRRWVRAWMQEPDVVIHGTNMPPYFTGLKTHDAAGKPVMIANDPFGSTVDDQTNLLLNFLYVAGKNGYATQFKPELRLPVISPP